MTDKFETLDSMARRIMRNTGISDIEIARDFARKWLSA